MENIHRGLIKFNVIKIADHGTISNKEQVRCTDDVQSSNVTKSPSTTTQ